MSRIWWARYEGGDIEAVAAMFICCERPTARRIRPNFTAPNVLQIAGPRVPRLTHDQRIPITRAQDIRHDYVRALATIQQCADTAIKVPDVDNLSPDNASEVIRIGRLLRESRITAGWDELTVTLRAAPHPRPRIARRCERCRRGQDLPAGTCGSARIRFHRRVLARGRRVPHRAVRA